MINFPSHSAVPAPKSKRKRNGSGLFAPLIRSLFHGDYMLKFFPVLQDDQVVASRRLCLTCLCSTIALISPSGNSSKQEAVAAEVKERAVCRNCNGSGAIICKFIVFENALCCFP